MGELCGMEYFNKAAKDKLIADFVMMDIMIGMRIISL